MTKDVKFILEETIKTESNKMYDRESDDVDVYKIHSQNVKDFIKLQQEQEKIEAAKEESKRKIKREEEAEEFQKSQSKKERILEGLKFGGLLAANALLSMKVMKFEENGTIRSKAWQERVKLPQVRFRR